MKNRNALVHLRISRIFILSFFLLNFFNAKSQTVYYDSISKQKVALIEVHKTYERVIEKGYNSIEMFEYLANYYYNFKDYRKSKLYFDLLFKKYKLTDISARSKVLYSTL